MLPGWWGKKGKVTLAPRLREAGHPGEQNRVRGPSPRGLCSLRFPSTWLSLLLF